MLQHISIENIAVIERCDLRFTDGFNLLTGETGAGKSIIIDAISSVLGRRTAREIIRTGASFAKVTAVFSGGLTLCRELTVDGKNHCSINGKPKSLAELKAVGDGLVHIFSQHQTTDLLDPATHLSILDKAIGQEARVALYRQQYGALCALKSKIQSGIKNANERARRLDVLIFEINEIESAALEADEEARLAAEKKVLSSHEKIVELLQQTAAALTGAEDGGVLSFLQDKSRQLARLTGLSPALDALSESAEACALSLSEFSYEISRYMEQTDFSPARLAQIEQRLDVLYKLKRKYGADVPAILAYLEAAQAELCALSGPEADVEGLKALYFEKKEFLLEEAAQLSALRRAGALSLAQKLRAQLAALAMPKVDLKIEVTPQDSLTEDGLDSVQFLFSANRGEALKPLHKVASGGELSRIMLAMKVILQDETPTLVFDEIDTGISGNTAALVGKKLKEISKGKQVLCISHLAQMAAFCDTHFRIEKRVEGARTKTYVQPLDAEGRVYEIARMSAGEPVTELALAYAREQLAAAGNAPDNENNNTQEE